MFLDVLAGCCVAVPRHQPLFCVAMSELCDSQVVRSSVLIKGSSWGPLMAARYVLWSSLVSCFQASLQPYFHI